MTVACTTSNRLKLAKLQNSRESTYKNNDMHVPGMGLRRHCSFHSIAAHSKRPDLAPSLCGNLIPHSKSVWQVSASADRCAVHVQLPLQALSLSCVLVRLFYYIKLHYAIFYHNTLYTIVAILWSDICLQTSGQEPGTGL